MNGMEELNTFDIFEMSPEAFRYNILENLRLKATLIGKDLQCLESNEYFKNYSSTLNKTVSKWFSTFNDFFDIAEGALYAKKD